MKVTDTNSFIEKSRSVHGDKYDYSLSVYTKGKDYIVIICPVHGEYTQRACNHTAGRGCRQCKAIGTGDRSRQSQESLINDFKAVHGDRYDYSLVSSIRNRGRTKIICRQHGVFIQDASMHKSGQGCKKCALISNGRKKRKTINDLKSAIDMHHKNKYKYDFSTFKGGRSKISIYCDLHGWFKQEASVHMNGRGCQKCAKEASRPPTYSDGFFEYESNKLLSATLYHVEITNINTGNVFQKVGISRKKKWMDRFLGAKKMGFIVREIRTVHDNAWNCYQLENIILESFKEYGRLYKVHDLKDTYIGGWTECFYPVVVK